MAAQACDPSSQQRQEEQYKVKVSLVYIARLFQKIINKQRERWGRGILFRKCQEKGGKKNSDPRLEAATDSVPDRFESLSLECWL